MDNCEGLGEAMQAHYLEEEIKRVQLKVLTSEYLQVRMLSAKFDLALALTEWEQRCLFLMDYIESGNDNLAKKARDTVLRAIEYDKEAK